MTPFRRTLSGAALLAALAAGCAKSPPRITEAEGRVLLDGKPLPNAFVQFMPELSNWGAEMNSTAVTDEKGEFRLRCAYKDQPGAAVATHRVLITEAPPPAELRGMDGESQDKLGRYLGSLKNRPIPDKFATYSKTPVRVEVKADQKVYELNLTR